MSQQINPIAVRDVVLDLDDKINFAVYRSGQNISVQQYPANSATSSNHVYSIQVPSTSTIMSRNLVWGAEFTLTVEGTVGAGEFLVNLSQVNYTPGGTFPGEFYGGDCFAPFPLNQLCTNMAVTLNNTSVNLPVNQVLDPILRAVDKKHFERWNGSTITQLDKYGDYQQALCQQYYGAGNAGAVPAGTTPVTGLQNYVIPAFNSPFNTFEDANCNNNEVPRNAFRLLEITGNTAGTAAADPKVVTLRIAVREPVFVSPFLFGESIEEPGLAGLTQVNINCQMDSSARRAFRWVVDGSVLNKRITKVEYNQTKCYMEATYYTPKPSDLIPSTIVTPLATYGLYQLPPRAILNVGASDFSTSNSIMLNSYPDKVFVWVDNAYKWQPNPNPATVDAANQYANGVADAYATIDKVVITLNNQSGILSTFDATQLFKASVKSGSQQTFAEFSGLQSQWQTANSIVSPTAPVQFISTTGSVLMLDFASIINISADYLAPGSLATAQFQITVTFTNNLQYTMLPQLNLLMMYSGILSTSNGSSSAYTSGVLTKENCLNAAALPRPMNSEKLARYVGSGLRSSLKSIASSIFPFLKKEILAPAIENIGSQAVNRISRKLRA